MELEELIKTHYTSLFKYALKLTRHTQKAEDLTQDTLVKIHKGFSTFKGNSLFTSWATAIMKNRYIDIRRRETLRWNLQTEEGDFTDLYDEDTYKDFSETLALINLELLSKHITDKQAKILYLIVFQQKTYREIGKELEIGTGSVFREIQKVRSKINYTECLR